MKKNEDSEIKKHIDCDWLIKKENGIYICYDSRSPRCGEQMDIDQANEECCEFFHEKKK